MSCPLLEVSIEGAKGVLFNITGGADLTLSEVQIAADAISEVVDPDANIFFGMATDPKMVDEVRLTIIARVSQPRTSWRPATPTLCPARRTRALTLIYRRSCGTPLLSSKSGNNPSNGL